MNSKSRKRLIIVALIIFNVLAIVKIADNTKMYNGSVVKTKI